MALQLRGYRVNFISKLTGVFIAVFALFIQPVVALDLPAAFAAPVINEVMPDPITIGDVQGEWLELKNEDSDPVDISGWTIAGGTIPSSTTLAANGVFVLCKTAEASTECDAVSTSVMSLANTGERTITLIDADNNPVDEFTYNKPSDSGVVEGESLEVVKENGEKKAVNNSTDNYITNQSPANSDNTGTPGAENRAMATSVTVGSGGDYDTLQGAIDNVADGGTVTFISNVTTRSKVNITKPVTINGNNKKLTAASGVTDSVIEERNINSVIISDLTVDGGGNYLHPLKAFKGDVNLENVTVQNSGKHGLLVNSATVTVTNIKTSGNAWGGIDVAQVDDSSKTLGSLTVNGTSAHGEPVAIAIGNTAKNVNVIINNDQYSSQETGGARYYFLKPDTQNPRITNKNPGDHGVIGGSYKISVTVTDDVELNENSVYANFNLASGEKRYTLNKEEGTDTYSATINTKAIHPKGVSDPFSISFRAEDAAGNNRSSKSQNVIIDNQGPSISAKTPTENEHINGMYEVSAIVKDANTTVDDKSVYARFRDNAGKEYTHYLTREVGTDVFSKNVNTINIGDGNTGPNRVSFFARDEFGTSRSSVSDGVVIDNAAPVVSDPEVTPMSDENKIRGTVRVEFTMTDESEINFSKNMTHVRFTNGRDAAGNPVSSSVYAVQSVSGETDRYYANVKTEEFVKRGSQADNFRLYIRSEDKVGFGNQTAVSFYKNQITIDNRGPSISGKTPAENATISGTDYRVSAIVSDEAGIKEGSVYAQFNDDEGKQYRFPLSRVDNTDEYAANVDTTAIGGGNTGPNRVSFRAVDNLGNPRSSVSDNVTIDNAAPASPAATFTADNDGDTVASGGTTDSEFFTFNLNNPDNDVDHYELKYWNNIEESEFKENNPWNKKDIPSSGVYEDEFTQGEGTHYFSFIACDEVGNCSSEPTVFEVTYATNGNGGNEPGDGDGSGDGTDEGGSGGGDGTGNGDGNDNNNPASPNTGGSGGVNPASNQSSTSTPGPISPLSQLAFNQGVTGANGSATTGSVLGAATTGNESDDDDNGDVLGTNSPSTDGSVKNAAVAQSPEGWKLFGIAWYWILLLLAALAALWWFLVARRNAAEDADL